MQISINNFMRRLHFIDTYFDLVMSSDNSNNFKSMLFCKSNIISFLHFFRIHVPNFEDVTLMKTHQFSRHVGMGGNWELFGMTIIRKE